MASYPRQVLDIHSLDLGCLNQPDENVVWLGDNILLLIQPVGLAIRVKVENESECYWV